MSEIFLIPPEVLQNLSDPPPNLIIKVAELVSVFEAEIDHPLGLLKVKAGNLRGTLIVVRIKLQNSHHINIFYMTDKKFGWPRFDIEVTVDLKSNLCKVARVNELPWQQDESLYLSHF